MIMILKCKDILSKNENDSSKSVDSIHQIIFESGDILSKVLLESSKDFEVGGSGAGSLIIGSLSVSALSSPSVEELSESSRLRSVHGGGRLVVGDNGVIVIDVGLQSTLSADGIVSLLSKSGKLLSPSGDSRVL